MDIELQSVRPRHPRLDQNSFESHSLTRCSLLYEPLEQVTERQTRQLVC